ncbi:short chain dehydrogenase [Mycobacterium leprae Kyoto-2]|uniref:Short-chain dehydrogenase/reductase family n=3 Tax=Mycobacterium leprae TaxID=1769 RepID=Q7AQ00_MYCLE|nr:SDR family oxidoreductase [Mycobacterium leprae]CAR72156.1 short-chain dehydrogenase/reductase family [Mycobacterium leprae Br4923]AWV49112.1 short-chain dehydrogenase [Mycobacterium leprae]OAR20830.1 short-chain dehydrogenase [Mycobacterium leprae 3125609]OAX72087.1 short-chain dehydrogenase [Mycobacterium leprae 7935681]CAA15443.1 oxidoreductase [Mycobacterium leprae]
MAVDVLVTGGNTDLGRTIAEGFRNDGHKVTLVGPRRADLEVVAKELDVDTIVCNTTDPASLDEARGLFPRHLNTIVNVPTLGFDTGDPRTFSLSDTANAWHNELDATVLSAVLTVQSVGDHLRSGGSIIGVLAENPPAGSVDAAIKAALSSWVAGQAGVFGTRGITVNAIACGRSVQAGYEGLSRMPPHVATEITRLALFLTTPASRHITGQTLHVSHGALTHF